MSDVIISPNMNLPVPIVGIDPGPDWANNINSCLGIVDSHDHTLGSGVQLTPLSLNINTDLPMNNNNLITARTVRFQPQVAAPGGAADLGCLTEIGVDLYYIDGSGNVVRLTQGGAPAGATGTITGLPSGTASASFSGTTFTFESATATPASMNLGPVKIAQAVASGFGVTISASGSQAANYALTLPPALPTSQSTSVSDTSGNLSFLPLASGSYAPTITAITNCTVTTPAMAMYMRIGSNVIVNGQCDVDPIAFGNVDFGVSLPFATTFGTAADCSGGLSGVPLNSLNTVSFIAGNTGFNIAQGSFDSATSSNATIWFWFQYTII